MLTRLSGKRNRLIAISLLLALAGSPTAGNPLDDGPTQADWTLAFANRAAAQNKAKQETSRKPKSAQWHDYAAWACSGLPSSLDDARVACQLCPDDYRFVTTFATMNSLAGNWQSAEKLAMKAAQLHQPNGRALAVLALCSEHEGKVEDAEKLANQAAQADGNDYALNMLLYSLYSNMKDPDKCATVARRLVAACPTSATAYLLRGKSQRDLHNEDAALADYRRAHELDPSNAAISVALARLLERIGRHDEAVSNYNDVVATAPAPDLLYRRAESFMESGKIAEALADYRQAIRLANLPGPAAVFTDAPEGIKFRDYKICWVRKTELLEQLGKADEAMASAAELLRVDANCDVALQVHESIARRRGNYRQAIVDLDKLIVMDNDVADWYRNRGEARAKLHNDRQAGADFARAKHLDEYGE
ncbi:MAG TPA: tetratricopeptide repeat protein [Candidatus Obscuribacterales bacterium]